MKAYRVLFVVLLLVTSVFSQSKRYPGWFLNHGSIDCENISVGYANKSYYEDSALAHAKRNGILSLSRNKKVAIAGEHGFWSTAIGTISMGYKIREIYDSSLIFKYRDIKILESYSEGNLMVTLLGNDSCQINNSLEYNTYETPTWMEKLPTEEGYSFAVGSSESFYYESSSWLNAERNARLNLAKQISIQINSVSQKENSMNQDIKTEDYSVLLQGIKVLKRWYDEENKLFNVLVRTANKS